MFPYLTVSSLSAWSALVTVRKQFNPCRHHLYPTLPHRVYATFMLLLKCDDIFEVSDASPLQEEDTRL